MPVWPDRRRWLSCPWRARRRLGGVSTHDDDPGVRDPTETATTQGCPSIVDRSTRHNVLAVPWDPPPLRRRRTNHARAVFASRTQGKGLVRPWLLRPATSAFETYRWARIVRFTPEARSRSAATSAMTAPSTRDLGKCADVPGDTRNFHLGDGGMRADTACVPPIRYQVCAQDGTVHAIHIRIDLANGKKKFTWELPDGTKDLAGRPVKTLPLYRSETLRALKPGAMVIVTEGEKAADALAALEFAVVATVTGSSGLPSDDVLRTLDGFHVVMWPDADVVGRKHADRVLEALYQLRGIGKELSEVENRALGLTGKGDDAADWTPKEDALDELFEVIRPWTPSAPPVEGPPDEEPPRPDDDPERPSAHMIEEGKTRAGMIKALEWVGIDVRFNERSARMELQDAIAAGGGARISYSSRAFVEAWARRIRQLARPRELSGDAVALRLVQSREVALKKGRARLANRRHLELWNGASGTGQLDLRWRISQRLLLDILGALSGSRAARRPNA